MTKKIDILVMDWNNILITVIAVSFTSLNM